MVSKLDYLAYYCRSLIGAELVYRYEIRNEFVNSRVILQKVAGGFNTQLGENLSPSGPDTSKKPHVGVQFQLSSWRLVHCLDCLLYVAGIGWFVGGISRFGAGLADHFIKQQSQLVVIPI